MFLDIFPFHQRVHSPETDNRIKYVEEPGRPVCSHLCHNTFSTAVVPVVGVILENQDALFTNCPTSIWHLSGFSLLTVKSCFTHVLLSGMSRPSVGEKQRATDI